MIKTGAIFIIIIIGTVFGGILIYEQLSEKEEEKSETEYKATQSTRYIFPLSTTGSVEEVPSSANTDVIISLSKETYIFGEVIDYTFANNSDEELPLKFDIEMRTDSGWKQIRRLECSCESLCPLYITFFQPGEEHKGTWNQSGEWCEDAEFHSELVGRGEFRLSFSVYDFSLQSSIKYIQPFEIK